MIVFTGDSNKGNKGFITYHRQSSWDRFERFINKEFPQWKWVRCYDSETKAELGIVKR
jgi:hypothetical protein